VCKSICAHPVTERLCLFKINHLRVDVLVLIVVMNGSLMRLAWFFKSKPSALDVAESLLWNSSLVIPKMIDIEFLAFSSKFSLSFRSVRIGFWSESSLNTSFVSVNTGGPCLKVFLIFKKGKRVLFSLHIIVGFRFFD